jgi:hypothetical protein
VPDVRTGEGCRSQYVRITGFAVLAGLGACAPGRWLAARRHGFPPTGRPARAARPRCLYRCSDAARPARRRVTDVIVDGYVRVSQVAGGSGVSFISPAVQREQIERWVDYHVALPVTRRSYRPWTYPRMKDELAAFMDDRVDWPALADFREAGLMQLYTAISRSGARPALAADLALTIPAEGKRATRPRRWTEARISSDLEAFLRGRRTWPTKREFCEAGRAKLYCAIVASGERDAWACRYRFKPPRGPRRRSGTPS